MQLTQSVHPNEQLLCVGTLWVHFKVSKEFDFNLLNMTSWLMCDIELVLGPSSYDTTCSADENVCVAGRYYRALDFICLVVYPLAMSERDLKTSITRATGWLFPLTYHVLMVFLGDHFCRYLVGPHSFGFFVGLQPPL